jgi:hypothetical protein
MRQLTFSFLLTTALCLGQSGRVTGTVVDTSGQPIAGAMVRATMRSSPQPIPLTPGKPPAFMPVSAAAPSGTKGEFQIEGLYAATYAMCVYKPQSTVLDPCLWSDTPVVVTLAADSTASGVTVTAAQGTIINIRVQDPTGFLNANPGKDDLRVGINRQKLPFIPALPTSRDSGGKTMSVAVPIGQPISLIVASAGLDVASNGGVNIGAEETQIAVPPEAVASAASGSKAPVLTISVTGPKP